MSSPPVKYLRYFDFTTFAINNPEKPLPGASVDQEYNRIKSTTDQTIDRLALIQNDDGTLRGVVGTANLMDGAVTTPKIADLAVTTPKIADGAVTGQKIAPGSLTGAALAPGSIGSLQIADGGVQTVDLADLSITTIKLVDLAVTTAKIALLAIGTAQLADLSITTPKLGLLSISTANVQDAAITAAKLAPGAVTPAAIPDGSLTGAKIQDGSIGTADLAPLSITTALLADGSVTTPKLADGAVTSIKLAPSLALAGIPTAPTAAVGINTTQIATTAFVAASMSAAGAITEAPNDGALYGRQALGWQLGVKLAGDTMTGPLVVPSLKLGGITAAFPMLKPAGALLTARLADDSGYANFQAANIAGVDFTATGNGQFAKLGIGMVPVNILDITQNQNVGSQICLLNNSVGNAAQAALVLKNSASYAALGIFGTGQPTAGMIRPDGALLQGSGAGGLTLMTGANQPIYFGINSVQKMMLDVTGSLGVGATPPPWGATWPSISFGAGGSVGSNTGTPLISLYNNLYYDGGNYRYVAAAAGAILQMNAGAFSFSTVAAGAAGAVAAPVERMRLENSGILVAPGNFGMTRRNVVGGKVNNVQLNMFSWPAAPQNLICGYVVELSACIDDSNSGYTNYSAIIHGHYSCFAGAFLTPTPLTVNSLQYGVNAGVLGLTVDTVCVNSGGIAYIRMTPRITGSGSNGGMTARITANIRVFGINDDQIIAWGP